MKTERTRVWEKLDELWDSPHGDNFFKYILSTFTQYHFHMFRCFHFVEDPERGQNARKKQNPIFEFLRLRRTDFPQHFRLYFRRYGPVSFSPAILSHDSKLDFIHGIVF